MASQRHVRARRAALGNTNAEIRRLKARIEGLQSLLETAEKKRAEAAALAERSEKIAMDLSERAAEIEKGRRRAACDAEVAALSAAATLEALPSTPRRRALLERLVEELTYRGVLPAAEDAS